MGVAEGGRKESGYLVCILFAFFPSLILGLAGRNGEFGNTGRDYNRGNG